MAEEIRLSADDINSWLKTVKAGDRILLSGTVYTARDAAHKILLQMSQNGEDLPIDLKDSVIYYCGPTPAKEGSVIGSAGPTTSCRMDKYVPYFTEKLGVKATIGKGGRSKEVTECMKKNGCVYLVTYGGLGALLSKCIKSCKPVALEYLGCESVKVMTVCDFPVTVAIDSAGNSIFDRK